MSTRLLIICANVLRWVSWHGVQKVGAFLGLLWFYGLRIRRRVVLDNLELALPDRRGEHLKIARGTYANMGMSFFEFLKMRSMSTIEISNKVKSNGLHHFEEAYAKGKGVIIATAHFGNFDLLACSQAARKVPLSIVSKELHSRGSNQFWMETRRRSGLEIFTESDGPKPIIKWLRAGKVLGLVVDQRTSQKKGGIQTTFLGNQVWTSTAAARLSIRTGAPIIPVKIERMRDGTHLLTVEPVIKMLSFSDDDDQNIQDITLLINQTLGAWVKSRPDHWMWLHRRFL